MKDDIWLFAFVLLPLAIAAFGMLVAWRYGRDDGRHAVKPSSGE
jgi:hypothetical protein